ncbi:hypothetical protein GQ53DRAFT_145697 [Thozetella sp. PMI_491]|nr:hypothetical protein GQ53DRAFT_145697 [Thozetella sp. PMI_491]
MGWYSGDQSVTSNWSCRLLLHATISFTLSWCPSQPLGASTGSVPERTTSALHGEQCGWCIPNLTSGTFFCGEEGGGSAVSGHFKPLLAQPTRDTQDGSDYPSFRR